jgi:hypothetical protein
MRDSQFVVNQSHHRHEGALTSAQVMDIHAFGPRYAEIAWTVALQERRTGTYMTRKPR